MWNNSQKGVSLIITFFIMLIILSVEFSIGAILYSELKIMRNMGNSVQAFFAADSGVEKVLYYDRKVLPNSEEGPVRGICYMCSILNPDACAQDPGGNSGDKSVYCNSCLEVGAGCDPVLCNDCQITFQTELDEAKHYEIIANIGPDPLLSSGSNDLFLKIDSTGYYKNDVLRAIQAIMPEQ